MKIYTKTGDKGHTSLIGGSRVPKHHIRIEAYGTIDELNCFVGMVRDQDLNDRQKEVLTDIQNRLFIIGSLLASEPGKSKMKLPQLLKEDIELLEGEMDLMSEQLPPLKNFILPGGSTAISYCQIARSVCRRAERQVVLLAEEAAVDEKVIIYLNRLSDYLFVLSRQIGFENNIPEHVWKGRQDPLNV